MFPWMSLGSWRQCLWRLLSSRRCHPGCDDVDRYVLQDITRQIIAYMEESSDISVHICQFDGVSFWEDSNIIFHITWKRTWFQRSHYFVLPESEYLVTQRAKELSYSISNIYTSSRCELLTEGVWVQAFSSYQFHSSRQRGSESEANIIPSKNFVISSLK